MNIFEIKLYFLELLFKDLSEFGSLLLFLGTPSRMLWLLASVISSYMNVSAGYSIIYSYPGTTPLQSLDLDLELVNSDLDFDLFAVRKLISYRSSILIINLINILLNYIIKKLNENRKMTNI